MGRFSGKVKVWHKETGECLEVWSVDGRALLKQGEYQGHPLGKAPPKPEPPPPPEVDEPPPADEVLNATYGPPELDDWTSKELKVHLLDRFNEKYVQAKCPRKSDLVRYLRGLYQVEEMESGTTEE
jgi:hypothetical protein